MSSPYTPSVGTPRTKRGFQWYVVTDTAVDGRNPEPVEMIEAVMVYVSVV